MNPVEATRPRLARLKEAYEQFRIPLCNSPQLLDSYANPKAHNPSDAARANWPVSEIALPFKDYYATHREHLPNCSAMARSKDPANYILRSVASHLLQGLSPHVRGGSVLRLVVHHDDHSPAP